MKGETNVSKALDALAYNGAQVFFDFVTGDMEITFNVPKKLSKFEKPVIKIVLTEEFLETFGKQMSRDSDDGIVVKYDLRKEV